MSTKPSQKINRLISKIISLLEQDIAELDIGDIKMKKDISSILGRLTNLTIQLSKFNSNNTESLDSDTLSKRDLEIIENFIEKYR